MIFTELKFFIFFAIVFALYWAVTGNRFRKILLLIASYGFYAAWDYRFLSLIVLSTVTDYIVGLRLANKETQNRKLWLLASLVLNLGLLAIFKYFNFFVDSLNQTLTAAGIEGQLRSL